MCLQIIYSTYMYKLNLALDNLQRLLCHKKSNHSTLLSQTSKLFFHKKEEIAFSKGNIKLPKKNKLQNF